MSFTVSVRFPYEEIPMPSDPDAIDAWMEERMNGEIYDEPLASDGDFFEYWYLPSRKLNLELILKIYTEGLVIKTSSDRQKFFEELNKLKSFWESASLDPRKLKHLICRRANALKAIDIASESDGWIVM